MHGRINKFFFSRQTGFLYKTLTHDNKYKHKEALVCRKETEDGDGVINKLI